jgi:hypothetical protein
VQGLDLQAKLQSAARARSLRGMSRARLVALPCLLLALVFAACGGSSASGGADPASAVPAGTAIYFEGVVRPEGSQQQDVLVAVGKVLRTDDPARKLHELIDRSLRDSHSGDVNYQQASAILASEQKPSFLLSMPSLLAAIDALGHPDASYAKAKPYLQAFSVIASGGSLKGDRARSRVAAGLR